MLKMALVATLLASGVSIVAPSVAAEQVIEKCPVSHATIVRNGMAAGTVVCHDGKWKILDRPAVSPTLVLFNWWKKWIGYSCDTFKVNGEDEEICWRPSVRS